MDDEQLVDSWLRIIHATAELLDDFWPFVELFVDAVWEAVRNNGERVDEGTILAAVNDLEFIFPIVHLEDGGDE